MKSKNWKSMVAAVGLAASASAAAAEEVTLTFATLNAPGIPINERFLHPWAEAINKDGAGVIKIDVRDGYALANFGNIYNRVLEDVVHIGFALQPAIGGKFPLSEVAGLPFVTENSTEASAALWRLYASGALAAEYADIQPLALVGVTQSGLHMAKPLDNLDSLAGKKIIVIGKTQADLITKLGGTPLSLPVTENFEALQRGTVDGTAIAWTAFPSFKLQEVTKYHVNTRLGTSTAMIFMSKKKWDALPQAAKDVLAKHLGEGVSRGFGKYWDGAEAFGKSLAAGKEGHTVVDPTPAQTAAWQAKADEVLAAWASSRPNGAEILAKYRAILADVKAGK